MTSTSIEHYIPVFVTAEKVESFGLLKTPLSRSFTRVKFLGHSIAACKRFFWQARVCRDLMDLPDYLLDDIGITRNMLRKGIPLDNRLAR